MKNIRQQQPPNNPFLRPARDKESSSCSSMFMHKNSTQDSGTSTAAHRWKEPPEYSASMMHMAGLWQSNHPETSLKQAYYESILRISSKRVHIFRYSKHLLTYPYVQRCRAAYSSAEQGNDLIMPWPILARECFGQLRQLRSHTPEYI